MNDILKILKEDARIRPDQIARMLGRTEEDVKSEIFDLEQRGVILGYKALVDWDRTREERVTALIELKVTPQKDMGFDDLASRILNYDEVESLYLMSGSYDFTVIITGKSLKAVSSFVSEALAPMDGILSTSTHFVLKKYKDQDVRFFDAEGNDREEFL